MIRLSEEQGSWLEQFLRSVEGAESRLLADQILDQLQHRNQGGQVIDRIYSLLGMAQGRNHITRDVVDALRRAILSPSELRAFDASMRGQFACIQCGRTIQPGEAVTYMPTIKERGVCCVHCAPPSTIGCQKCGTSRDIAKSFHRLLGRVKLTCSCKDKSLADIERERREAEAARPQDPFGRIPTRIFNDPETGESFAVGRGGQATVTGRGGPQAVPMDPRLEPRTTEGRFRGETISAAPPPPQARRSPWASMQRMTLEEVAERDRRLQEEATFREQQILMDRLRQQQMEQAQSNARESFRLRNTSEFFAADSFNAAPTLGSTSGQSGVASPPTQAAPQGGAGTPTTLAAALGFPTAPQGFDNGQGGQ